MKPRRYSIVIADRQNGAVRRFTLSLWPTLGTVTTLFALPLLMGLGARWSASATLADLQTTNAALRVENASYHDTTGQLANQISALQSAVDQLDDRAAVDPAARRAMQKLPAVIKSQAMGGPDMGKMLSSVTGPETALGVLSDVLGVIETRLDSVRDSVERRHALAAATPSIWPVAGWLSSPYGNRIDPFNDQTAFHPGLDISAEYGAPVVATADATVSSAGDSGAYGLLVVLDHGFGIVTKYGHLSRIAVMAGQTVKRGDVLGYVGSTGRSTGPHLHYEIWMNGRLTNPMTLLAH
ncbi:MAG TPA: M23 family metallopeptidase [Vicinamibacterales bacterium]|jgi:murein DD-endopeptidase MepM/ murein hydrolase activator NlpD